MGLLGLSLVLKIYAELWVFHFTYRTRFDCGTGRTGINPKPLVRNHSLGG